MDEEEEMVPNGPCCFCGEPYGDKHWAYGHNPEPLATWPDRCCGDCNEQMVIPARLKRMVFGGDPRTP